MRVLPALGGAVFTGLLLLAPAGVAIADPQPPTAVPTEAAAGWLARQLVDGERMETVFDGVAYPDHGLTADVILGLDAAKVGADRAAAATAWLAEPANLTGYVGDGAADSYAGSLAKLALVADVRGLDPTSFGGVDLIARLTALKVESGRFSDRTSFDPPADFSNAFSQSLAIIVLERQGTAPADAVRFLAASQCAEGGFPLDFGQQTCDPDVDATAVVVQALLAAGDTADAAEAVAWLGEVQQDDGGFLSNVPGESVSNANSTGVAATALRLGGDDTGADDARDFLLGLQVDCSGAAGDRGAIAFDATEFVRGTAPRATAQALLGLTDTDLTALTGDGSSANVPVLDCATPTTTTAPTTAPTTTPTAPPSETSTTTPAPTSTGTSASVVPVPQGRPGALAATGASPGPMLALGGLLLAAGTVTVLFTRRRRESK